MSSESSSHLFLVDGSGYLFRAFHALPPMTRPDGTPVNAVYGFTNMMMRLFEGSDADHLAVIFDAGRVTFRNEIYDQYKAQRPDPPEELIPQFGLVRDAVRALNVPSIEIENYEADDLIATYAKQAVEKGWRVTIVSSDKDLMQLVNDHVEMLDPMKNRTIRAPEVMEKFGVGPDKVVDVQSLAGDSVDNVPGVPGIGIKTAAQLITEYGDLDTLLARAEEIKQPKRRQSLIDFADQARISRDLVRLKDDVPLNDALESLDRKKPEPEALLGFLETNGFKSILARVRGEMVSEGITVPEDQADPDDAERAPKEKSYVLVQDEAALQGWIEAALDAGVVAVDTETSSLDAMQAELVGISLSLEAGKACYIPVGHKAPGGGLDLGGDGPTQIIRARALEMLKPLLEHPGVIKIAHNLKYDWLIFAQYDIDVRPIDDTMVISYVLEGGQHGHGLDELAKLHLGHDTIKFKDVAGSGKSQIPFAEVPLDKALEYAAEDADICGRLHRMLKPRLVPARMVSVYETLDRPLISVLADMEKQGIKVDRTILSRISGELAEKMTTLEREVMAEAGRSFNIGSPKQLGEILFEDMGLPGGKKTKTGAYATNSDVLEPMAAQFPIIDKVLSWRQVSKLKSTYADALVDQINPKTGRVHTSYMMTVANTGRLSSTDPNLQNIPIRTEEGRRIREAFVAEEGNVLLSVDYSQIELRLVAHMAGIDALKTAFRDGLDIHAHTAAQVFGMPVEEVDGETRRKAKAINFGIIYGISGFGLSHHLGVTPGEANAYIKQYLERLPELKAYLDDQKRIAREGGFVKTLFGRHCFIRGINDRNPNVRGFAERQAINAPIQGTAADIIKRAMKRMPGALKDADLAARMLLQVHDELVFEVPEAELEKTSAIVRAVMEGACAPVLTLDVPLIAEAGSGKSWAEAH